WLPQAIRESHASSDLVIDLVRPSKLEQVDEAPAVALEGEFDLRGRFCVADGLLGNREQFVDFVLAALSPMAGVERERERRGVAFTPSDRHGLPSTRLAAVRLAREVKLHRETAEQSCPKRGIGFGRRGESLLEHREDRAVGAALLDPAPAEAERREGEVLAVTGCPRQLGGRLKGGAAVVEFAGLAV